MIRSIAAIAVVFALSTVTADATAKQNTYSYFYEDVLGTSLEIQVKADSPVWAGLMERTVRQEIKRLDGVFSTYNSDSEISRWMSSTDGASTTVSVELYEMLQRFQHWHQISHGALNPAVGSLIQRWKQAEATNQLPSTSELHALAKPIQNDWWTLSADRKAAAKSNQRLTLDAAAKGYIIDKACEATWKQRNEPHVARSVTGLLVNIGGDLRTMGDMSIQVKVADPFQDADNQPPIDVLRLKNLAVATSGNYRRGFQVGKTFYSHILDPRTGQPANHIASATVVSTSTAEADAFATIFSVLPPQQSLELADRTEDVECLVVDSAGNVYSSSGWAQYSELATRTVAHVTDAKTDSVDSQPWNGGMELTVDFEINRPGGGRSHRPYVAVWVEDKDGFPIRTLALYLQTDGPGPRWHRDLRRWYKNDQMRQLVDTTDLISTISVATRPPGKYKVVWDGKDDAEKLVKPGKYTVYVEAAREHGTYQLIKKELEFAGKPFEEKLDGNVEIKAALLKYGKAAKRK